MNILIDIQQRESSFTITEKNIADYILNNANDVVSMTAEDLSGVLHVSTASLVRFSRTIGLTGFTELKQRMSAALTELSDTETLKEVEQGDSVLKIKRKVRIRIRHMADQTNNLLSDSEINSATNLMFKSNSVFIFGLGASGLVAQDLFQKFSRIGKHVFFVEDLHLLITTMTVSKEDSCLILVSNSGETYDILKVANAAELLDIPIIALTGNAESTLAKKSRVSLLSVSGESMSVRTAATISLMAQLYVVDILFYRYISVDFDRSMGAIQQTRDVTHKIEKNDKK